MKRRVFNLLTVMSLVLGIGVAAFWADSYGRSVTIGHVSMDSDAVSVVELESYIGGIVLQRYPLSPKGFKTSDMGWFYGSRIGQRSDLSVDEQYFGRFDLVTNRTNRSALPVGYYLLSFPWWLPLVGCTILPAWWLFCLRRAKRRSVAGCCVVCGYDLRATPERCPECGTVPQSAVP